MKSYALTLALSLCCAGVASQASASEEDGGVHVLELHPLSGLDDSLIGAFSGWRLAVQLSAMAGTGLLVGSGADTKVHNFFVDHRDFSPYTTPGVYTGYFLPMTLGGALAGVGLATDSRPTWTAGCAVVQALLLATSYQSVLKAVTGRRHPDSIEYDDNEASRQFRFGVLRGGIDWGWPSGLMLTNTAVVVALSQVYPDSIALRLAGALYLGAVGASSLGHETASLGWLSDTVAGTLMGAAIGAGVGNTFGQRLFEEGGLADRMTLSPMVGEQKGLLLTVALEE